MAERINSIQGVSPVERVQRVSQLNRAASGQFGALLNQELKVAEPAISFSKHAQSRAAERGIQVDDTLMGQLADSVERAQAKGATNILAFDATRHHQCPPRAGDYHHVPGGDGGKHLHKYRRRCTAEVGKSRTFYGCFGPLPD